MNALIQELAAQIDVLESKRTHGFGWKPLLDQIVKDINAVNTEAVSVENSGNPLFRILGRKQQILMALVLLVLIAAKEK